jgi:hypothetical protein
VHPIEEYSKVKEISNRQKGKNEVKLINHCQIGFIFNGMFVISCQYTLEEISAFIFILLAIMSINTCQYIVTITNYEPKYEIANAHLDKHKEKTDA